MVGASESSFLKRSMSQLTNIPIGAAHILRWSKTSFAACAFVTLLTAPLVPFSSAYIAAVTGMGLLWLVFLLLSWRFRRPLLADIGGPIFIFGGTLITQRFFPDSFIPGIFGFGVALAVPALVLASWRERILRLCHLSL